MRPAHSAPGKLAAQTARRIEDDIIAANWPVGEVLGSEAELMGRYDVSRAVLREAVRLVEHHGLASMRRGPAGGLVVREPDVTAAITAVVLYLEYVGTSVPDLLLARQILEPLAASLAAERIDEAGIRKLRQTLAHERTVASSQLLSTAHNLLHLTIAELSGNTTLELFIQILAELTARYATARTRISREDSARTAAEVGKTHDAIASAIISGDAATAQHRSATHLAAMHDWFTARRRPHSRKNPALTTSKPAANLTQDKLAEVVARRIRDDILDGGWQVGDVIGSESELLDTYGVSRAVLREAVRLLEHHAIAKMRRGPGGGLIVTEPDPNASVEAIALYLEYRVTKTNDLRRVREALELGIVDLVADRAGEPEIELRLNDALLLEVDHVHEVLAEASDNPVLALLLRIAICLWARRLGGHDRPAVPSAKAMAQLARVHGAIVEAVLAGDHGLARHRMRRHLATLTEWWQ